MDNIQAIFNSFVIYGDFFTAEPYGNGHINDTYMVRTSQAGRDVKYLFQRINHHIFENPENLMDNISRICHHLQQKLRESKDSMASSHGLTVIPSVTGKPFVKDGDGAYWRCYLFIEDALGYDIIETEKQAFEAAKAFGQYQNLLSTLPGNRLFETIPDFHNTPKRYKYFQEVINKDPFFLVDGVKEEIAFFQSLENEISYFTDRVKSGVLPERITHNDTKLNNVLLDTQSGEAVCIIDLDTSMPGLAAYDFGDLVRTSTCPSAEDEKDLSKVIFQNNMFEALIHGYMSSAASFLTEEEVKSLVFGAILITYETGLRFLTDYLEGSIYFKSKYAEHNLVRSRTQMTLVKTLLRERESLEKITLSVFREISDSSIVPAS